MLHTKFHVNRPAGSGDEDLKRVFTIYGHGGHLGHVTSIMSSDFHFLVPESIHKKNWFRSTKLIMRKSGLNFCMYTTLVHGQEMTLTFTTHISSYIQLNNCSY